MNEERLRSNLIEWFLGEGRRLPWRETSDPYAVCISEFMLQQTRVETVLPYFKNWMHRFPDVASLAEAGEDDVLAAWQGLGYYSRARNLHRLARAVLDLHDGAFPCEFDALRALPGVGDYTAAAIRAFAFDLPSPVVDANVARVLARLFDFHEPVDSAGGRRFLARKALELQFPDSARLWNSAIMELGALLCRPGSPDCASCPVRRDCRATTPFRLPVKKLRPRTERVRETRIFWACDGSVYLEKSAGPRWKSMWILPLHPGFLPGEPEPLPIASLSYPITRYLVEMAIVAGIGTPPAGLVGFPVENIRAIPIPSPHRRALAACIHLTSRSPKAAPMPASSSESDIA